MVESSFDVFEVVHGIVQGVLQEPPDIAACAAHGDSSLPRLDPHAASEFSEPAGGRGQRVGDVVRIGVAPAARDVCGGVLRNRGVHGFGACQRLFHAVDVEGCHVAAVAGVLDR